MKNKKGFTLVEILVVIVVLAIVILISVNVIDSRVKQAKQNAIEVNANNYIKAVNGVAALSQNVGEDMESGTYQVIDLNENEIRMSGEKPTSGYLVLENYEVSSGCLTYNDYAAVIEKGKTVSVDIMDCSGYSSDYATKTYAYTGSEQVYTAFFKGTYKLEVWGAQGGGSMINGSLSNNTSFGGYSVAYVDLKAGEKLYVNVGGKGSDAVVGEDVPGGYNGGGIGTWDHGDNEAAGGGGGATHIAKESGLLSTFSSKVDKLLIVAGGSGGRSWSSGGGSAGGYAALPAGDGRVANQLTGYQFGKGQDATGYGDSDGHGGGGGGFYGGYESSRNGGSSDFGGGGSSYIGNSSLYDKMMFCYGCEQQFTDINTFTVNTIGNSLYKDGESCSSGYSENPVSYCAKSGDGYAKITLVSANDNQSRFKNLYILGNEVTKTTGGWYTYESENGRANKLTDSLQLTYSVASGDTTSQFITTNLVDVSGYNTLNINFEVVSTANWGQYSSLWLYAGDKAPEVVEDWNYYTSNTSVGMHQVSLDITNLDKAYVYLMNQGANMKIYHVWLSK